jgi:hypothetical protein
LGFSSDGGIGDRGWGSGFGIFLSISSEAPKFNFFFVLSEEFCKEVFFYRVFFHFLCLENNKNNYYYLVIICQK